MLTQTTFMIYGRERSGPNIHLVRAAGAKPSDLKVKSLTRLSSPPAALAPHLLIPGTEKPSQREAGIV